MCEQMKGSGQQGGVADSSPTIVLTQEQLEELIEACIPNAADLVNGLSKSAEPSVGVLWEKCGPCVGGVKPCVKCSWRGCRVRLKPC